MLMAYVCSGCGRREVLYNARDGVTPPSVGCRWCGAPARHSEPHRDVYAPDHVPAVGDRLFLDTSRATLVEAWRAFARQVWNAGDRPMKEMFPDGTSIAEAAEHMADREWALHDGHVPSVVEQTEEMERAMMAEVGR